eukprot:TRINITY_DN9169_c0_g1_i4.p1 TRINITY_DN9169_c0_g1~~TRINITY_DN9169_c0_g1_i4.p1  ORF type:complete len:122 (+),score=28.52 TRINITY_DN9169_c0_g1_i4:63-428(+)
MCIRDRFKKVQPLPSQDGQQLRIRFISQVKIRPPTFTLFVNDRNLVQKNYLTFMRRSLMQEFGFGGIPIRFLVRDAKYQTKKRQSERMGKEMTRKRMFLKQRRQESYARRRIEILNRTHNF